MKLRTVICILTLIGVTTTSIIVFKNRKINISKSRFIFAVAGALDIYRGMNGDSIPRSKVELIKFMQVVSEPNRDIYMNIDDLSSKLEYTPDPSEKVSASIQLDNIKMDYPRTDLVLNNK